MHELEAELKLALEHLKDFQAATVKHVFHQLFDWPRGRMLVADEVGLGKTIVAKGVIAEAVRRHLARKVGRPFKVAYICSNQVIAQENQQKLQIFKNDKTAPMYSRIAELAYSPPKDIGKVLEINSLTPATSFNATRGAGNWVERLILYRLLLGCFPEYQNELKTWMRYVVGEKSWDEKVALLQGTRPLRSGLPKSFRAYLVKTPITLLSNQAASQLKLGPSSQISLWKVIRILLTRIRGQITLDLARWELLVQLRRALIECCIDYIDADLFILDEFQRFRQLLDETGESEEAKIAKRIFSKPDARILLLSATPFKAFSGSDDEETGEAHYHELKKILDFLATDAPDDLLQFEDARRDIHTQLIKLGAGSLQPGELCDKPKIKLEKLLSRYICRTERAIASGSGKLMLKDSWSLLQLPFSKEDITTFRALDQVALLLARKDLAGKHVNGIVEYAKSAPFPLSYLDGYQFKELLRKYKNYPGVQSTLSKNSCAWLDDTEIDRYSLNLSKQVKNRDGGGNARLKQLVQEAVGEKGHLLLWVPPSLPYYQFSGPFAGQGTFSKTLVFSSWQLVPKMIGTLLSYEVERRTIGTDRKIKPQDRKYFHGEKERRNPQPQLKFKTKGASSSSMSLFSLLYPCVILSDLVQADLFEDFGRSYNEIKKALTYKISSLLKADRMQKQIKPQGKTQPWYWYAPFLLDQINGAAVDSWILERGGLTELKQANQDMSALESHFKRLEGTSYPHDILLGEFPDDLAEQLAIMALGSPAIACLRSLRNMCPDLSIEDSMVVASQLASGFLEMYNKPEAISTIRHANVGGFFWQRVLLYGGQGCIHSMVDEYLHMLFEQAGTLDRVKTRFLNSTAIFTASVNVESLKAFNLVTKTKKMRCHYAVDMGNQKIETEEGQQRVVNIRESFNSPFRPFVLASTSIGQEGLDFHWYCRRIVHWNVPGNPIDLEQREGRINRYKSLVIRRRIASRFGSDIKIVASGTDIWEQLMRLAEASTNRAKVCQLQPFWHVDDSEGAESIERLVPIYPFSKDAEKLDECLKILTLYRLTFGQPRQDELLNYLLKIDLSEQDIALIKDKLLINLSPLGLSGAA